MRRLLLCREAAINLVWIPDPKQAVLESHGVVIKLGISKTLI